MGVIINHYKNVYENNQCIIGKSEIFFRGSGGFDGVFVDGILSANSSGNPDAFPNKGWILWVDLAS